MRPPADPWFDPPFVVSRPSRRTAPWVFNVPHAGLIYPDAFVAASRLDRLTLRRSEDAYVDALFAGVVPLGAPLMAARFPRAYLDVNREPYELDPRMFDGRLPAFANVRSMRVAGGLGTVPRIVADGQEIYRTRLPVDEALGRIERLYKPYHRALHDLMAETAGLFGHAILVDCHSMPSPAHPGDGTAGADVVLGDRYGTSCAGLLTDVVDAALRARGYTVARNKPYAGGFITEHHGEPALNRHALQVEINRALYMDQRTMARRDTFEALARDLAAVFADAMAELGGDLGTHRIAAE